MGDPEIDWRCKAHEASALASLVRDPESKRLMVSIARAYEALAQHSERCPQLPLSAADK